jgi:hypothetical protein
MAHAVPQFPKPRFDYRYGVAAALVAPTHRDRRQILAKAPGKLPLATALVLIFASLIAVTDAGAQTPEPTITVLGEGVLPVKATPDDDGANVPLIVVNTGPATVTISKVSFEASSWVPSGAESPVKRRSKGVETGKPLPSKLPAGATRVVVRLSGLKELTGDPVEGQLILYGEEGKVLGARSVSITPAPPEPSADWPKVFFWGGLVAFCVFGLTALITLAVRNGGPRKLWDALTDSAPGPDWTFDGWSGKLAAVGGLLAVVLGAITLPAVPSEVSKDTLVQLNVVFVALLAVGPFIFYALRRRKVRPSWDEALKPEDMQKKGVWGIKGFLLLSYVITAVAVIGQIGALTLLGWELMGSWVVPVIIGGLLAALAFRSFSLVTCEQADARWDEKATAPPVPGEEPLKHKDQPIRVRVVQPPAPT